MKSRSRSARHRRTNTRSGAVRSLVALGAVGAVAFGATVMPASATTRSGGAGVQTQLELLDASSAPQPISVAPFSGPATDLTGNQVGCASNCIVSALLSKQALTSNLGFAINTNVSARTHVWISTNTMHTIGGVPVFPGVSPKAVSPGYSTSWTTNLGGLAFDTSYNVIVRVTDLYGNKRYATTTIRTIDPAAGDLAGNGGGCYYQCITSGVVETTETYSSVRLIVTTSVDADIDLSVSHSEPGWIGSMPVLPDDEPVIIDAAVDDYVLATVNGLSAGTEYNVLVRATDDDGFTSYALGSFTTNTPPRVPGTPEPTQVVIQFEKVTFLQDGDPGINGKGEIELRWGLVNEQYYGEMPEAKINAGDVVSFPANTAAWDEIAEGAFLPEVLVNAIEADPPMLANYHDCDPLFGLVNYSLASSGCATTTAAASTGQRSLAWMESLPTCSTYGIVGDRANAKCVVIGSGDLGNAYAEIEVLISYRVL